MRIALTIDHLDLGRGGLPRWVHGFAAHLVDQGHDVHVVAFSAPDRDLDATWHIVADPGGELARPRAIARGLAEVGADVVHDTGTGWSADVFQPQTGSILLAEMREVAASGLSLRLRAALSPRARQRRRRMAAVEQAQIARAKRIVAVSRLVRDQLVERHRLAPERLAVVPNGVDTRRFSPDGRLRLRAEARRRMGLDGETLFVAVADNLRLKGVDIALRAVAALRAKGLPVRLAVAGGVPDDALRRLVGGLGLADTAIFHGRIADMPAFMAAADALVHPTRWDACSLSTGEAMACGLPVVTTHANGAAELIADGTDGFTIPAEDVVALADRMRRLLDAGLRGSMGVAARQTALRFDMRANFSAVERILVEVAQTR